MASITTPSHDSDVASGTSQPPPRLHAASSRVREPRSFTSGLFECSDPATCCRVACCWPVVTGELAQRVLFTRRKHVCFLIAGALWALLLLRAVRLMYRQAHGTAFDARIELLCGGVCWSEAGRCGSCCCADVDEVYDGTGGHHVVAWLGLVAGGNLCSIAGVGACVLTCLVRRAVRRRDAIAPTTCMCADDALCAACCLCCTQAQILQHEGLAGAAKRGLL
jgi:hypothetical protein